MKRPVETAVTIKDVARLAKVSIATVSRILNGSAAVSPELAARVMAAVRELNYRPNAVARALKERKSSSIGLVIPDIENPFFPALVRGVEDEARRTGYAVILCNTDGDPVEEERYIHYLFSKQVDGILFIGGADSEGSFELLATLPTPVVTLDRRPAASRFSAVVCDNHTGASLAVDHLLKLGKRDIALIGGPMRSSSSIDRRRGYVDTLMSHGLAVRPELMKVGDYSFDSGFKAAEELVDGGVPFDAVFAANDMMAIGAIEAFVGRGIKVPSDIAVVGYDDIRMAGWYKPSLTTIRQPVYDMGIAAVSLLVARMKGAESGIREEKFVPELIVRDSSGVEVVRSE